MLHTYRKTATIQAEQFDGSKEQVKRYPIIVLGTLQDGCVYTGCPCVLKTKEGGMNLKKGDYIATGIDGEHWAIDQDIFERTYERVD
nr:MAG TPA: PGDYG protein [Caudoviricetes sp.]